MRVASLIKRTYSHPIINDYTQITSPKVGDHFGDARNRLRLGKQSWMLQRNELGRFPFLSNHLTRVFPHLSALIFPPTFPKFQIMVSLEWAKKSVW